MEQKHSFKELVFALREKKFFIILMLGFSAGLPIMLVASTIKIWLRREGVDLSNISYLAWLMLPYSFNFLWAPLLDNFYIKKIGRRRTWIFASQICLVLSMICVSMFGPHHSMIFLIISVFGISLSSATQDVAIDAYRRELMSDDEQGVGSALYVYGYRVGMLIASGFGLWSVDPETLNLSFNQMFLLMGVIASLMLIATYFADEPKQSSNEKLKFSFSNAVILPFKEFLTRKKAWTILFFVLFFKFGDGVAGSLLSTFYVDMSYSNKIIAEVTKGIGFFSSMIGLGVGASVIYILGIYRSLVIFGIFQMLSTAFFAILPLFSGSWIGLALIVGFEDFSSGLGTTAMVAFMSVMADKRFTATQYALLASLAAIGKTIFSGFAGNLIQYIQTYSKELSVHDSLIISYQVFFVFCSVLAIPGLILAVRIIKNEKSISAH